MQRPVVLNLRTGLDETLCIDATLPRSHSVLGSAPVIMNTCWMSRVSLAPVLVLCNRTLLRCVSPSSASIVVLDGQRSPFNAELTLAQARGSEYQSLVQLYKALGGGWQ